jgi:hypothetical protein
MRIEGAIHPRPEGPGFNQEAWSAFVGRRPEFRALAPRQARNPFSGEAMTVYSPTGAGEIMVDGRSVGRVSWSMSEEPLVNVSVEPSALPLVREWAAALGGEFRQDTPESSG